MINMMHFSANILDDLTSESSNVLIWEHMAKRVDNLYLCGRNSKNCFEIIRKDNITQIRLPKLTERMLSFTFTSLLMFFYVRKFNINRLLCQDALLGGITGVLISRIYDIPVMIEVNSEDYIRWARNFLLSKFQRFVYSLATSVRVNNSKALRFMEQSYQIDSKVKLIPHRVELSLFDNVKTNYELTNETLELVSVGRLVWEKHYPWLIQALDRYNCRNLNLTIIGTGPQEEEILSLNRERLGLKLVKELPQKSMAQIIRNADVYIQSSVSESGPRTLYEAMALGMPVISTSVGIAPDLITKEHGILIQPNDEMSLHRAITHIVDLNSKGRKQLGINARLIIEKKYEWNRVFDLYINSIKDMR
jgi:glycosyltransferase involved in cell wall biosynthesis